MYKLVTISNKLLYSLFNLRGLNIYGYYSNIIYISLMLLNTYIIVRPTRDKKDDHPKLDFSALQSARKVEVLQDHIININDCHGSKRVIFLFTITVRKKTTTHSSRRTGCLTLNLRVSKKYVYAYGIQF